MEVCMSDNFDKKSYEQKEAEVVAEHVVKEIKKEAKSLFGIFRGALDGIRKGLSTHELSYEEVMKYFVAHKNDKPGIVKGALLKENAEGGFLVTQTFLDKDNKIVDGEYGRPLGYKRKVSRLDKELLDLFKDKSLIIVE
jgi:hypothetical protein